jgi:iron complex outermembrane recepter protein
MTHLEDNKIGTRSGWLLAPVLLAVALAAHAQGKAADPQGPKKDPQGEPKLAEAKLQEVIVTGSRIARPANDSEEPTIVTPAVTFEKRGYSNVGQALTELPEFGVQPSSQQNQQSAFGVGQSFVDLYSLGSQRTLVLVNGRRFVSSNASGTGRQVDLNDIPIQLIDRVETISIGGAPIYGADAISGTVNIITKKNYQGLSLDARAGTASFANSRNYTLSALAGKNFANGRGNVVGVVEYTFSDGFTGSQDPYFATHAGNVFLPPTVPGQYKNVLLPDETVPSLSTSGVPFVDAAFYSNGQIWPNCQIGICNAAGQPLAFAPGSSALTPYNVGNPTGSPVFASGGDGINFVEFQNLQARISRLNADVTGHFDWSDHLQTFWEGWYSQSHNASMASQPFYESPLFTAPGTPSGPLVVSVHNPYLSAGDQTLIANALSAYAAAGYPGSFGAGVPLDPNWSPDYFYLDRASSDLEGGRFTNNDVLARGVLGMKGDFTGLGRDFHWDVAANYGYSRVISLNPAVDFQNLENAVNSVRDSSGQIVCAPGYTNSPFQTGSSTCAPLDPFGYQSPSAASLAYITHTATAESYDTQRDVTADLTIPMIELPGGSWEVVTGYENRRESSSFNPDTFYTATPSPGDLVASPLEGAYHTNEFYAETLIPVVEPKLNLPALHRVELDGAIRRVDNSIIGISNTWTAGVRWAPTRDILFRFNKTRAIRDPSIAELFLPASTSFEFAADPCDHTNVGQGPNPALRNKNCEAAGINPSTFASSVGNATVQGTTSGNTGLQSEVADSYTWGVMLTPRWVPNLAVSFDYLDIKLTNAIEQLNLGDILNACYDSASYPNVPECSDFTRNAAGQIVNYHDGYVNAGLLDFQGASVEVDYRMELPWKLGAIQWTGNYLDTKTLKLKIGQAPTLNLAGQLATVGNSTLVPKSRAVIAATYLKGPFSLYMQGQFTSGMNFNNSFTATSLTPLSVHNWWVFNSSVAYQVTGNVGLRLVVNNVFDKRPPYPALAGVAGNYFGTTSYYYTGILGRTYMLEVHADLF